MAAACCGLGRCPVPNVAELLCSCTCINAAYMHMHGPGNLLPCLESRQCRHPRTRRAPLPFAAPTPTPPVPHYMHPPRQTATSPCKAASHATLRYPYTATADAWYSHLMAAQALARAKVKSAWKGRPASTIKPCHLEKRPWICWPSSDPILILSLQPSRALL